MTEPMFVVEGEIDALSIIEVGHIAIGLGSASNYKKLVNEVAKNPPQFPLLIALDNDETGRQTSVKLLEELQKINVECYEVDINGKYKDSNEYLVAEREKFKSKVEESLQNLYSLVENKKNDYVQNYSAVKYLREFVNVLNDRITNKKFEEVIKIESFKDYNKSEEMKSKNSSNTCCLLV